MAERQITWRIADALEVAPEQIRGDTKASEVTQWDSMGTLSILVMLNRDYGVHVEPNETNDLGSVEGIVGLLRAKGIAA